MTDIVFVVARPPLLKVLSNQGGLGGNGTTPVVATTHHPPMISTNNRTTILRMALLPTTPEAEVEGEARATTMAAIIGTTAVTATATCRPPAISANSGTTLLRTPLPLTTLEVEAEATTTAAMMTTQTLIVAVGATRVAQRVVQQGTNNRLAKQRVLPSEMGLRVRGHLASRGNKTSTPVLKTRQKISGPIARHGTMQRRSQNSKAPGRLTGVRESSMLPSLPYSTSQGTNSASQAGPWTNLINHSSGLHTHLPNLSGLSLHSEVSLRSPGLRFPNSKFCS